MDKIVIYDTETTNSTIWGSIIEVGAVVVDKNLKETAQALGLSSIWIGMFDEQKVMDILQTDLVPSSLLCIGYPKQTKFPKPRRNLKDLVNVVW